MKKRLLTVFIALMAGYSSAQTCNPQYQDSTFGAWPDTVINFAVAYVEVPYIQVLDFKAPSDAGDIDSQYAGATINHYTVTSVTGLPSGFSYQCSATNCQYPGGQAGCAQLTGTAASNQTGTHNITIVIQANLSMPNFGTININYTFPGYKLIIEEELSTSLISPDEIHIFPNPATSTVGILNAQNYEMLEIYGVNGQLAAQKAISSSEEKVDVSELKEGIYFIHLVKGTTISVHKFVKK